jgi:exopolyphosphatase/guanosine-5'-triphosphate,3'-diphosphate pyrophosphatase
VPSPRRSAPVPPRGPETRRLAAVDLGTNTVRLLVVEVPPGGAWRALLETQRITRLGEGLGGSGRLGEAAMRRTLATVAEFCRRAAETGAREVLIVATSAVREAENRAEFVERVRRATGHPVRVVPGGEEARLALLGALQGLPRLGGSVVLLDIGGGSTEVIVAEEGRLRSAVSLPLGVVPLAERYVDAGPVAPGRAAALAEEVAATLGRWLAGLEAEAGHRPLVGTAGTVTTLAALDQALPAYDPGRVHGYVLPRPRIEALLERLRALPLAARAALPCLEPGRADLIVPGAVICVALMQRLGATSLTVSEWGLREGILVEHLRAAAP